MNAYQVDVMYRTRVSIVVDAKNPSHAMKIVDMDYPEVWVKQDDVKDMTSEVLLREPYIMSVNTLYEEVA
jgi:hypothetical protein